MKNVLIIDEYLLIGRLIEKLARRNGAVATIARNGIEARSALQSETKFDLIFLDLVFPDINGWDILTAIKIDSATEDIPVVILTGRSLSGEDIKRLQGRVKAIIDKNLFESQEIEDILQGIE